jgi:hypothetical protein
MQTTTSPHMNPNHPAMPPYHPPPLSYCSNVPAIMSTAPPTSRRTAPAFAGPRHPDGGSSRAVSVTLFICELLVLPERHVIVPDGLAAAQKSHAAPAQDHTPLRAVAGSFGAATAYAIWRVELFDTLRWGIPAPDFC